MRAWTPRPVPDWTASRSVSPVEIAGMSRRSERTLAWVPFPAPGKPRKTKRIERPFPLAQEAFVVAHHQLRLDLLHRLERDTHRHQDRRPAERKLVDPPDVQHDRRDQRDRRQEQRPRQRDPYQ